MQSNILIARGSPHNISKHSIKKSLPPVGVALKPSFGGNNYFENFKYQNFESLKAQKLTKANISFGKSIKEHTKYQGANYNPQTKKTDFRIWATPDHIDFKKGIELQVITPEALENSLKFKEIAKNVNAEIPDEIFNQKYVQKYEMNLATGKGEIFEALDKNVPAGSIYRYVFYSNQDNKEFGIKKGDIVKTNDPRAYYLPNGIDGWGSVVDDSKYIFKNPSPKFKDDEPVMIYEANIAALTKNGDFKAACDKIPNIAKKGFTHIQVMPLGQSVGKGWGYAALPYAISKDLCGEANNPDDFKHFVDTCHQSGLGVIVDVNYNHFTEGFSGNNFAEYKAPERTPWGDSYNYSNSNVRDFSIDDVIRLVTNYKIDGIRFDSTHCMTNGALRQVNLELEGHALKGDFDSKSNILKIGEDYNLKTGSTEKLTPDEIKIYYDNWKNFNYDDNNASDVLGLDAAVSFDSHHMVGNIVRKRKDTDGDGSINGATASNVEKMFKDNKSYGYYPPDSIVGCLSAHDDIQDMSGTRLISKGIISILNADDRVFVRPEMINDSMPLDVCKKRLASNLTQEIFEEFKETQGKSIQSYDKQIEMGIIKPFTLEEFKKAYAQSKNLTNVAVAEFLLAPGKYKMNLMGEEKGVISPFKLFMESKQQDVIQNTSNFYLYDIRTSTALPKSNLEQEKYENFEPEIKCFYNKLMELFKSNPALKYRNDKERTWHNDKDNVFEVGYKKGDKKIYAVLNMGDNEFENYGIQLTKGNWKEAINSDDKHFGGSGMYSNKNETFSTKGAIQDYGNTIIKLGPRSVVMFETISPT